MKNWIWIVLAIVIVGLIAVAVFVPKKGDKVDNNQTQSNNQVTSLQITDERVGTGIEAKTGDTVTVDYVGTLTDGTKFDSSYDRHQPFSFVLGNGEVIEGWDKGVVNMKVGGKRKLVIPASMGYGATGAGSIPPNATLIFEIELLSVK